MDFPQTRKNLIHFYQTVRQQTLALCQPLEIEDYVIQSMDDVSPPKWHLAHTSWFFENFILIPAVKNYQKFDPTFTYLFNSYYFTQGCPFPRGQRGWLARPSVKTIYNYRNYIDRILLDYLDTLSDTEFEKITYLLELGIHHEQQHQELLLMDVKYNFFQNPNYPAYEIANEKDEIISADFKEEFNDDEGGIVEIGSQKNNFCFDNELPHHQHILKPFSIAKKLVTNGEFLEFIKSGGYHNPIFWLADGWECAQRNNWQAPLYWLKLENDWSIFTLKGLKKLPVNEPVCHVSYYEADAYARWKNFRLPSEHEWEHFVKKNQIKNQNGILLETNYLHPRVESKTEFFGNVWIWTASNYAPYPGYEIPNTCYGEYNGKFMSNQMVLRGGSCLTPKTHIRATYRNYFACDKRWQCSGVRLAK